jgi:2-C-methyl-D-erythritol 4-phosphate cytidylyltransferase
MPNFSVILAAAGRSSRFNDPLTKKPFTLLNEQAAWLYSAKLFRERTDVKQLIIVVAPSDQDDFLKRFRTEIAKLEIEIIIGGDERADSIEAGLAAVDLACDFVAIHDAARPCIDSELIERVFAAGVELAAAIPTVPIHSTIKRSTGGERIEETVDRSHLYLAQTPQVYARTLIQSLYAKRNGVSVTDESQLAEQHGQSVAMVAGSPLNLKITTQQDLQLAAACLEVRKSNVQGAR